MIFIYKFLFFTIGFNTLLIIFLIFFRVATYQLLFCLSFTLCFFFILGRFISLIFLSSEDLLWFSCLFIVQLFLFWVNLALISCRVMFLLNFDTSFIAECGDIFIQPICHFWSCKTHLFYKNQFEPILFKLKSNL